MDEHVFIFENFLENEQCKIYIDKIKTQWEKVKNKNYLENLDNIILEVDDPIDYKIFKMIKNIKNNKYISDEEIKERIHWMKCSISITQNDYIVRKVKFFLEEQLKTKLSLQQAEIQIREENTVAPLHKHDGKGREKTDFNSVLYLNDDYEGGEFYTEKGVVYKPRVGSLIFFNGEVNGHGIKRIIGNDRYAIVFWWNKPTIFLN